MTSSPVNELHDGPPSPLPEREDDVDVANDDQGQGQNWLTIRRRCELCKQRKVRSSDILASFVLAHPVFEIQFEYKLPQMLRVFVYSSLIKSFASAITANFQDAVLATSREPCFPSDRRKLSPSHEFTSQFVSICTSTYFNHISSSPDYF
jgi:uncharacterized membrane protein